MERTRLQAALKGELAARVELGKWMSRELFTFFADKTKYPTAMAYDLTQATCEALLIKLDDAPDDPKKFRRHMIGFAKMQIKHEAEKYRRERARIQALESRREPPSTSIGTLMYKLRLRSEQLELLEWAIALLPHHLREAIENYLAEQERKSLALKRRVKVRTIDRAIWAATDMLRDLVQRRRVTPPSDQTPSRS